jgi:predicted translation initiation factor SUI1
MGQRPQDWKSILSALQGDQPYIPEEPDEQKTDVDTGFQPGKEMVMIYTDSKRRKGKTVTIIQGIEAETAVLEDLSQRIKAQCGTGGTVKDGEIMLQGDVKLKVQQALSKLGFKTKLR